MGLRPAEGTAWWWTVIVGRGRALVAVRDHEVDPPKTGTLEIRASGLWAEPVCETPLDHWSLGLEAVALALDDPADALGTERGKPVPLGLDLEWEAAAPAASRSPDGGDPSRGRYGQSCVVHGDVLVGRERLPVAGAGTREHAWGERDWWGEASAWAGGRLADGTPVGLTAAADITVTLNDRGMVAGGRLVEPGVVIAQLLPVHHAPLRVPAPTLAVSHLARALCRLEADDGRGGWAWAERLQPASSTRGPGAGAGTDALM